MEQPGPDYKPQHVHPDDVGRGRRQFLVGTAAAIAAGTLGIYGWHEGWVDRGSNAASEDSPAAEPVEGAAAAAGLGLPPEFDRRHELDLAGKGAWSFMPGVTPDGGKLHVRKTGRALRTLPETWAGDTPEYIADPPINIYGTHLQTNGKDFGIGVQLSGIRQDRPAILTFYSQPDYAYDERRYTQPRTQVTVYADHMLVEVWNGNGPTADAQNVITSKVPLDHNGFWLRQEGKQVVVSANQQEVRCDATMFAASGEVWFGFDGEYTVDVLTAYPAQKGSAVTMVDTSSVSLPALLPNSLQSTAAAHRPSLRIGAAVTMTPVVRYGAVAETIGREFGALKPETTGKMQAIYVGQPGPDGRVDTQDFIWDELDAFVDLARRNGRAYNLHALAFGEAIPAGVEALLRDVAAGRRPLQHAVNFINSYAQVYVSRYPDAAAIDVVNEPLADTGVFDPELGLVWNENAWWKAFGGKNGGERYIEAWCNAARKAGAKNIYINDNGAETSDARAKALIAIAEPLRRKGLVQGVGLQAHLDRDDIEEWYAAGAPDLDNAKAVYEYMSARFAQFARAGLQVQVSELSIDEDDPHVQAMVGYGFMRAAVHAANVSAVFLWSPVNGPWGFTAEPNSNYEIQTGNDGPWDWDAAHKRVTVKETLGGYKLGLAA